MSFLHNNVYDQGLSYLDTNGTQLHITSQEVTAWANVATYTLGNATVNTGAPAAGSPDGRQVTVPSISAGSVTGTGTATHWCLTDGTATVLAANTLSASQAVTSGNTFTLGSFTIRIPAPA